MGYIGWHAWGLEFYYDNLYRRTFRIDSTLDDMERVICMFELGEFCLKNMI